MRLFPVLMFGLVGCGLSPEAGQDTGGLAVDTNILMIGDVQISPATVSFGAVKPGGSSTVDVVLTNLGDDVVNLSSAYLEGDPNFTMAATAAPADLNAGGELVLSVTFEPEEEIDYTGGLNLLISGEADFAVLPIDGTGAADVGGSETGNDGPQLSVSNTNLSFGEVKVNDAATQLVTLSNSGDAPLTISGVSSSSSWFEPTLDATPLELLPGDETALQVRFAPQDVNTASAQITIANDAGNNVIVNASGKGGDDCTICNPVMEISTSTGDPSELNIRTWLFEPAKNETVTIRNLGDRDLVISNMWVTNNTYDAYYDPDVLAGICGNDGTFSITSGGSTLTVPPNEIRDVTIQYSYSGAFNFDSLICWDAVPLFEDSFLNIESNDPGGRVNLTLVGRYSIVTW
ncbi:MAG: choice-of-anchor D domain-containing protein [Myxococcota bacterium]